MEPDTLPRVAIDSQQDQNMEPNVQSTNPTGADIEQLAISVIRGLALDGPNRAKSGHQGTAMALAPLAHVLFTRIMNYDAGDPDWPNRDRFVLSGGHASILLYSMLYLTGQGIELDDIKNFRQWGSNTPGHPEVGVSPSVEVTTGPLGQGFANAVGMAVAERRLRSVWGSELCDHRVYVTVGDGDLSEGLSHEAASLAGHLGLGRLNVIYDDNRITIDGSTDLALSDDPIKRFEAYGWHIVDLGDSGEDLDRLEHGLRQAADEQNRPSLIVLRTHIGFPSPSLTDTAEAHGLAFGDAEVAEVKAAMGMPVDQTFNVPAEVLSYYRTAGARGTNQRAGWNKHLLDLGDRRSEWDAMWDPAAHCDPLPWPSYEPGSSVATRKASQHCISVLAEHVPAVIGGSADLTGNTGTSIDSTVQSLEAPGGRQIYFGVREHAMGAALVGAARHGGVMPIGGTFLVFADYMRPAVRLAAMSQAKCVFVWTHDSVGVGEDGPTHQPIEQVMSLRAIPGLRVIRPADGTEVAGAWELALRSDGPTAMILSRQDLPVLSGTQAAGVGLGAYPLNDVENPDVILVATGSEVSLCVQASEELAQHQVAARVVSMPCWEQFETLPSTEQHKILPREVPAVSIEAGVTLGWDRYADVCIGLNEFGHSAPCSVVMDKMGLTVARVVESALALTAGD